MARALKVYRTPIGFHDAYVAAPSQKAVLEAWGSDANLFARGMAEIVTDPALTAEPLARPGEVVKRLRGTAAEQIAALPPDPPRKPEPEAVAVAPPAAKPKPAPKPKPRPDRAPVERAERSLADAEARHDAEAAKLRAEEARLADRRHAAEKARDAELARLQEALGAARTAYAEKLRAWRA